MRSFVARYSGTCAICGDPIQEGEQCAYADDEAVHLECAIDEGYDDDEYDR